LNENIFNQNIYNLFISAAYEFPESAKKWMPEWLTTHPSFAAVKGDRVRKIFEHFGLKDFKEKIQNPNVIEDFRDLLSSELSNIVRATSDENLEQVAYKLLRELMNDNIWKSGKAVLINQIASEDKKFRIDAGTSVIKAYNKVKDAAIKLGINAANIETTQEFKNYSKRGSGDLNVVFSTNPTDIAAMSSRSDWGSCQSLYDEEGKITGEGGLNVCVIGSTLSKFIGIIYITTGESFQERGEKMAARSLVRFVIDIKNNKPAIIIDKMYPNYNYTYAHFMEETLSKHSSIPVIDSTKTSEPQRFLLPKENIPEVKQHEQSYLDDPKKFSIPAEEQEEVNFPVENPKEFIGSYSFDLIEYIATQLTNFILSTLKPRIREEENDLLMNDIRQFLIQFVGKLLENLRNKILTHYKKTNKPFSSNLLKSIINKELRKTHKMLVEHFINQYKAPASSSATFQYVLKQGNNKSAIIDYLSSIFTNL
jgi:hypothetical protein